MVVFLVRKLTAARHSLKMHSFPYSESQWLPTVLQIKFKLQKKMQNSKMWLKPHIPPDFSAFSDKSSSFPLREIALNCLMPCTSQACIFVQFYRPYPILSHVSHHPLSNVFFFNFPWFLQEQMVFYPQHLNTEPPSSTWWSEVDKNSGPEISSTMP